MEQDRAQRRIAGGAAYATEGSMKRCLETAPLIGATPLVCAAVDEVEFMSDSLKRFLLCCCFASMGCTNDVEPLPASAIVYGTVFSSSGSPIAGPSSAQTDSTGAVQVPSLLRQAEENQIRRVGIASS